MKTSEKKVIALILSMFLSASIHAQLVVTDEETPSQPTVATTPPPPVSKPADARGQTDILDFVNRDRLHGTLLSIAPDQYGLKWKHENATGELTFSLPAIGSVTLKKRSTGEKAAHNSVVQLTNDDLIECNITSLDDSTLTVDTWYSGKIEIKRAMLKSITPSVSASKVVYEGPNDISEWTMTRNNNLPSWKVKNGTLYSLQQYPIGKMIDNMPEMADIQFDIAWRRYLSLQFSFFTDNIQQYYGNCYMLQLSGSSVGLQRYSREGNSSNLGRVNIESLGNNTITKARINMLVDKKKKTFTLMINGQMIKQWTETGNFGGMGNGILFQPQDVGGMKISNIRVAQWNGQTAGQKASSVEANEDTIRLSNDDKVSGQIKSISNGNIKFATSYATMDIPTARAACIEFARDKTERARRNKNDLRAIFTDKGIITIQITQLDKDKLTGTGENFGNISIPVEALRRLDLNIYREKDPADEDDLDF